MKTLLTGVPLICALLLPALAFAQVDPGPPPPPPPPVLEPPPPPPQLQPQVQPGAPGSVLPGTPPPPGYVPGQAPSGYPYSPYGTPLRRDEKPGPEVGLIVSETLFGMLTAAGISLLPYFLIFYPGTFGDNQTVSSVILGVIFGALPLAVAQTQVSLANGSRFYYSEAWPASLAGLGAEALTLTIYFLWSTRSGAAFRPNTVPPWDIFLLVMSIGFVPLVQAAVINFTKQPRVRSGFATPPAASQPVSFNFPGFAPVFSPSLGNAVTGGQVAISGRFFW